MKKIFYASILFIASILFAMVLAEIGSRIALAIYWKPAVLLYGTPYSKVGVYAIGLHHKKFWGERRWDKIIGANEAHWQTVIETEYGAYRKYSPGFKRPMVLPDGSQYTSVLNNNGMRGRDFELDKKQGVIRVITLGASSTYGYRNRDDETYPYYLELLLNKELAQQNLPGITAFEVFNFGMPQFYSDEIRALFMNEALSFKPDIVTFYEGANDTRRIKREKSKSFMIAAFYKPLEKLGQRSLLALYLRFIFDRYVETFSAADVEAQIDGKPDYFVKQVQAIEEECKKRGVIFIAIAQSLHSETLTKEEMGKIGYDAEVEMVRKRNENGGRIGPQELMLLIHAEIMAKYQRWALAHDVAFVDFISSIERHSERANMQNWVHLHAAGNRLLADDLCKVILKMLHSRF